MHYRKWALLILIVGILSPMLMGVYRTHGAVTIASSSISPVDNTQTLDTTPDFKCTPVSDSDATVNVTLYVDGSPCGTENNHANNTEVTITCNTTLTEDDDKIEWYFSVTDSEETENTTARNIGIGAYFKVPVRLSNENYASEHWTYYLNHSVTDSTEGTLIRFDSLNITMDGQYNTLDGDDNQCNYGVHFQSDSEVTANSTVKDVTFTDIDYYGMMLWKVHGNTIENVVLDSCDNDGLYFMNSDSNTVNNITISDSAESNFHLTYADSNTIDDSTLSGSINYYNVYLVYSSTSNVFTNNTISDSLNNGVFIDDSNSNTFTSNTISDNADEGISITGTSASNLFYNNLINNTENIFLSTGILENYWNTTKQHGTRKYGTGNWIGGNYWTHPTGDGFSDLAQDRDGDGLGDLEEPYILDDYDSPDYNYDYHVLTPWFGVPYIGGTRPGVDPQYKPEEKTDLSSVVKNVAKQIPPWGYVVIIGSVVVVGVYSALNSGSPKRRGPTGRTGKRSRKPRNNLKRSQPKRHDLRRKRKNGRYV